MPHLDQYEADGIDAAFADSETPAERLAARVAAERALDRRDARERRARGEPEDGFGRRRALGAAAALGGISDDDEAFSDDEDDADGGDGGGRRRRRRDRSGAAPPPRRRRRLGGEGDDSASLGGLEEGGYDTDPSHSMAGSVGRGSGATDEDDGLSASAAGSRGFPRGEGGVGVGGVGGYSESLSVGDLDDGEEDGGVDLDEPRGDVGEWLKEPAVKREVVRRFLRFLRTFRRPQPADSQAAASGLHSESADGSSGGAPTAGGAAASSFGGGASTGGGRDAASTDPRASGSRGEPVYVARLRDAVRANATSLEVSYVDLARASPTLAVWVADHPRAVLALLSEAATLAAKRDFPEHADGLLARGVRVRICEVPLQERLRDLRHFHLGQLVRVEGIVTRRTAVYPQLTRVAYLCLRCGAKLGPYEQRGDREPRPAKCPLCGAGGAGAFALDAKETSYRSHQRLSLSEAPDDAPAGRLPRSKEVLLLDDLVDAARPGDRAVVTGVYAHAWDPRQAAKAGFPVLATYVEAVHVAVAGNGDGQGSGAPGAGPSSAPSSAALTDEDAAAARALARSPDLYARICASIAPRVHGQERAKEALALALFGGREKHPAPGHRLRGDVNVLLLGDPGTAKSQLLRAAADLAPRAVYTTGKGASAVGLTASVRRDPATGEWTLEGGALVLADRGVACIDEFDKMDEHDRVSIHEAMEQQSISVSKAGIVTSLRARCAVLAAANPIGGRYDASRTLSDNVELTDPILSRFDAVVVIRDVVDPVDDERLARFVVATHATAHPDGDDEEEEDAQENGGEGAQADDGQNDDRSERDRGLADASGDPFSSSSPAASSIIPKRLLRSYIAYARAMVRPRLQSGDYDKIARVYAELRRESGVASGMPMAVRHLESMIRMAEARASMFLRDVVLDEDVDAAIRVMLQSFVTSQKLSVQKTLWRKFRRYVADPAETDRLVLFRFQRLLREARTREQIEERREREDALVVPMHALRGACKDLELSGARLEAIVQGNVFRNAGVRIDQNAAQLVFPRIA